MAQITRRTGTVRASSVLLLALLVGACGGGVVTNQYYLIDSVDGRVEAFADRPPSVRILDLGIPEYLDRFQLAARDDGNQILYSQTHQWAEPLRKNLIRAMAAGLSQRLGTPSISTVDQRLVAPADLHLQLHLDRFETDRDGYVRLVARWQVLDGRNGTALATDQFTTASDAPVRAGNHGAAVAAMQSTFAALTDRVAASIAGTVAAIEPAES